MSAQSSISSQPSGEAVPFGDTKARQLFGLFIFSQLAGGLLVMIVSRTTQPLTGISPYDPIWMSVGMYVGWASFVALMMPYLKKRNVSVAALIGPTQLAKRELVDAVLVAIACLIFSIGTGLIMVGILEVIAPEFTDQVMQMSSLVQPSSLPILQNLLTTGLLVIVAPTVEEFLFRGLLLHRWTLKWSLIPALIAAAIVFGVLHINPVGLSVFGIMMTLLYLKTCKLAVPMVAHAINNSVVALALWLPQAEPADASMNNISAGIVSLCLALPLLSWLAYKLWVKRTANLPYGINQQSLQESVVDFDSTGA